MLITIVIILIILWFLGYAPLQGITIPNVDLFSINNHPITLYNLLILFVVAWAIGILPSPFRQIASILLLLWVLSILGIIAFAGLSSILVIAIILGLIFSIVQ